MEAYEKIARITRTDKLQFLEFSKKMETATGRKGVCEKIMEENDRLIAEKLEILDIGMKTDAKIVYDALISKVEADNHKLNQLLGNPDMADPAQCDIVMQKVKGMVARPVGFFIKKEKAIEFLHNKPPKEVLEATGCATVADLLKEMDVLEAYAALRFIEGGEWLNKEFFPQYEVLTPDDFEWREIEMRALGGRWKDISAKFAAKKWHNLSHLKELGFIFSLPITLGVSGELLRNFTLLLHYCNEIAFYSSLFSKYAKEGSISPVVSTKEGSISSVVSTKEDADSFAKNVISLLRGDCIEERLPDTDKAAWLVIPRYFAKDDENDWRLFEPRINPEAMHWEKAEHMLDSLPVDFSFWKNLNWVGDYFTTESGVEVLVSFNLVDTVMALVQKKELIKYLYHHQESLWNKVFTGYMGEEKLEAMARDNILKGYFEV